MNDSLDPLLHRPIIVIGAPRSGTTLLGNLLKHHPALAYLEEPRLTWRFGNDRKSDLLRPEDARPGVRKHIRMSFAKAVRDAGKQRLLEKTPSNALRLGFVEQVLPGCQFVHIIRDGTESVLSIRKYWQGHAGGMKPHKIAERLREIDWRRAPHYFKEFLRRAMPRPLAGFVHQPVWGPRIPGIDSLVQELDLLEVCCLQWRMCVEMACQYGRQLPSERYFECRLEDISPELLEPILEFCQLDRAPEMSSAFDRVFDPALLTRRCSQADAQELETIRRWIEPTLRWLECPRATETFQCE